MSDTFETKETISKNDLQTGDIVVTRSGELGIVIMEKECIIYQHSGGDELYMFTDDLLSEDGCTQCDIMEVYSSRGGIISFLDYKNDIPVFVRKEEK